MESGARINIANKQNLTPLTLAAKLAKKQVNHIDTSIIRLKLQIKCAFVLRPVAMSTAVRQRNTIEVHFHLNSIRYFSRALMDGSHLKELQLMGPTLKVMRQGMRLAIKKLGDVTHQLLVVFEFFIPQMLLQGLKAITVPRKILGPYGGCGTVIQLTFTKAASRFCNVRLSVIRDKGDRIFRMPLSHCCDWLPELSSSQTLALITCLFSSSFQRATPANARKARA
ncbi:hypothetical protein KIN20_035356 [Parelaphostrongylus tenuis]|uniref:Uncharacterized protein n=1 Tax=Parelaphostrongylus tenuis TaxID=148309 RepID=A0AAD5RB09_PARTN|nr:hypothetical protein KIN20_035356 [Parelaphostrongylus tenuis]